MNKIILTVGITGSGKDLWVNDYQSNSDKNVMYINRDEMRCKYFTESGGINDYVFDNEKEKATKVLSEYQVLTSGADEVIIADTNLNKSTRNRWKNFCKKQDFEYQEILFHTGLLDALSINLNREFPLPELVIANQFVTFNKYITELEKEQEKLSDQEIELSNSFNCFTNANLLVNDGTDFQ